MITDAVFYNGECPKGYNCHMTVPAYIRQHREFRNGALIVCDMCEPNPANDTHEGKSQLEHMQAVFSDLRNDIVTINCRIANKPTRVQNLISLNTQLFVRNSSGSVLRGSTLEGGAITLVNRLQGLNPIIIMGFDANMCVHSSIFGSPDPMGVHGGRLQGLLDMHKTVITSKILLVPLRDKLYPEYGIIAGI